MAKLDAYKFMGGEKPPEEQQTIAASIGSVAISKVVTTFANANANALGNINTSVITIDQTLKGLYSVSMSSIKNDKLRDQAERRKAQRERDAAREEEIESGLLPKGAANMAKTGKLDKREEGWASKLFKSMFGGLGFLFQGVLQFLISLATFGAVRAILQIVGDEENKKKLELFFTKLKFVWDKIAGFTSWLVKDNLLDGFTSLFGENNTFGERLQGLGKILIGIIGLKLLLDPFGLIFGVLDLLNAREATGGGGPQPGGPQPSTKPGSQKPRRIPPTKKRDTLLKRSRVDRLGRLRTSLKRIKLKQAGIVDYARVGIRRPGRIPSMVGQGLKQTPKMIMRGFKGLAAGAKGVLGRIPVVGALINFVFETLDVDEQGNLKLDIAGKGEKAAYTSIGMALGAAVGSFIPVPILGTIVGSMIGSFGGELIYDLIKGSGREATLAKMRAGFNDAINTIKTGAGAAGEFIKGAWDKWYRGVDKVKFPDVPNWVKNTPFVGNWVASFPIWGMMVPDPRVITDPIKVGYTYGMNFFKSLFGGVIESGKTTFLPGANKPAVGQNAKLGGSPVVWDGNNWIPKAEYDSPTSNQTTTSPAPSIQQQSQSTSTPSGYYPGANQSAEMRALLNVIAYAEGTRDDPNNGYNTHFGYDQNADLSAHPNIIKRSSGYSSAAFGRYQFMPRTWIGVGGACKAGGPIPYTSGMDMSPPNQDKGAAILCNRRGVSTTLLKKEGFSVNVSAKLSGEWASLPNAKGKSAYDQPVRKYAELAQLYDQELGRKSPTSNQTTTSPAQTSSTKNQWWDFFDLVPNESEDQSQSQSIQRAPGLEIGSANARISSGYGMRVHPVHGDYRNHKGIDIAVPTGTYISVKEPGEVMAAGTYGAYGQLVDIWIPSRSIQLRFTHVSQILVARGDKVDAYTPLARSGGGMNDPGRGTSTGPHIHFEADRQKDGRTGHTDPSPYINLLYLTKNDPFSSAKTVTGQVKPTKSTNNQWWDFLNLFPDQKESSVPGRPVGQKATLMGKPVVWDGDNWIPDQEKLQQQQERNAAVTTFAALMKGVLALPQRNAKGLTSLDNSAIETFIDAVKSGKLFLYLAPEGTAAASAALNGGADLLNSIGGALSGFGGLGGGAGTTGDVPGGVPSENLPENLKKALEERQIDPFDTAYSKDQLDDPIGTYLNQAFPDPTGSGPSGNPFSQPLTKEGILNNFYGYNPLSLSDGWEIFKAKLGIGGAPKPKEPETSSGIDFGSIFDFSSGAPEYSFSSGGQVSKNLPQAFLGKIFKKVGNAVSGIFKGVSKAFKSVTSALGGFLNSPLGQIVSFGLSFIPGVAPVMASIKAVLALSQGDILGALTSGMGALGGFFPGTFGAGGTFFQGLNSTFGDGLGGVIGGFLTGGFGGALGALPGMLPPGLQNIFKGIGGFLEENQGVANLLQMLPGIASATGFGQMLGIPDPQAMGGLGTLTTIAEKEGAGGIMQAILGNILGQKGYQESLIDVAAEIGVNPEVLGGVLSRARAMNPLDEKSREYALQSSIEIQQMPIIVEKLVEIPKGVPINNYVGVPIPVRQTAEEKK